MKRRLTRRVKRAAAAVFTVAAATLLTGCGGNGWEALPTDDGNCMQVTEWESNGFTTHHSALGTFCKQETTR
jgi:hypothetical protein